MTEKLLRLLAIIAFIAFAYGFSQGLIWFSYEEPVQPMTAAALAAEFADQ